jgi:hypothetical protein
MNPLGAARADKFPGQGRAQSLRSVSPAWTLLDAVFTWSVLPEQVRKGMLAAMGGGHKMADGGGGM